MAGEEKPHIVFLTKAEINALLNLCRIGIKMAEPDSYFEKLNPAMSTAFEKLKEKYKEL